MLLPSGQRANRAPAQVGDAHEVECFLDSFAHHCGRNSELLHAVGELLFDRVRHESVDRILHDDAYDTSHLTRRMRSCVETGDRDSSRQDATGEVRHQTIDRAEQRRLPDPRPTDDQAHLAFGDVQRDLSERRHC